MIACQRFTNQDYDGYAYFVSGFNDEDGIQTKRIDSFLTNSVSEGGTQNVQLGTSGHVYGAIVESKDADVYVATSGSNVWNCGDTSNQCKTVTYGGNKVKANYKVIVAAGEYSSSNGDETSILVNMKTVRIEGGGSSSTSVSFIKPTFFQTANMKVTTGTLSVSAISLTLNVDSTDTWHLIEVDGSGSATLTNCILKGTGSAQNGRLVNIIGGSLTATGCEFNNIHSTLNTGAAIHADLESTSSLTLSSSSFTNCKLGSALENVGAALFIHLQDNAKTYTLSGLTFAGGEANRAADIFISTPTLNKESEYLTEDHVQVSWQNNAADNLRFRCFSRDSSFKPQELGIPFYIAVRTKLFVNSSKSDEEDCGSQDAPCQSVTYAGSRMTLSGMTVFVMVSAHLKGTTDIAGCSIQPEHESNQATLQVTEVSSLTITDTKTAAISRIDFAFETPLSSSTALLSTSTGSFVLQSCSFKSSGSVVAAQTLITVSATGAITTDGLRVSDLSFSSPAISITSSSISVGDVIFSSCSFTGTLPDTLVSISPSSSCTLVSVGKVSFTSFSTTSSPSSSSELTLALISGPSTSTFTASTATLITSAAGSLTSNTAISFSGSTSSSVPLLKLSLGSTFSATVSNTKVVFNSSTNAGSTAALADSTSSSLSFSTSTIDTSNLSGFFTSSIFVVPANTLSISFSSLTPFLSGSSRVMSVPLARVTGGSLSLSKVELDATILSSSFTSSVVVQSAGKVDISESHFWSISSSVPGSAISATLGSGASLSLSAVAFTSCTSTADGGALSITLTTGSLSLQSTSFKKCSSSLNGGAIWMDLLGMSSPSQYSLIDTVFGTGADANHAVRSGHHVYVIAKDLSEVIVASRWAGSFDTAEDADLWGMDSESNEMSLLPILKSHVIAVGENGSDDADGTFASPFRTLHRCLEWTKEQTGPFTVEIVKKATIGRSCSLASQPSTTVHVRGSGSSGELLCSVSDESSESGTSISSGPNAMVSLSLQTLTFSQIVFSSFSAQRSTRFVFSLMSSSRLVLTSCSISSSAPLSVSLVSASSSSSFSAVALATSALSFVGKASLVVCGDQSRISIASSSFSSTSFDAGAVVWGSTRGDVSVEDTAFVGCGGREFGSLIRVKMAGCTTSIKKCRFVSCSTVLSLSERGGRRIVGGGCVLVEMARQTPVPRSLPPSCADLSLSSFTSCSLINTDLPHSLSSSSQFVGGSAFAIVSHDNSGLVKLPKVALSNCTCEHFASDGVFDGGVVVGEGQPVRTDRRGCVVDKCSLGSIVLH
ncbi:hypothetical protein BLNAU_6198 [Blattamonas nauphoetae]|uniref:Uncharacterized protein n=1 Tax=Blattamonas nauphoetae TaxID=2049346 RepID=A0ABQ9Y5E8_9EUKA|nr:hypothetical protein BLNAU_6198 [Blattamonas nauphoetae]